MCQTVSRHCKFGLKVIARETGQGYVKTIALSTSLGDNGFPVINLFRGDLPQKIVQLLIIIRNF